MDKQLLEEIIIEQKQQLSEIEPGISRTVFVELERYIDLPHVVVISGMRRTGKSTLLAQIIQKHYHGNVFYFNFEDERLLDFDYHDFNLLFELFVQLYGQGKVFCFDEIQRVEKWDRFVRRMQDRGYKFYITGSNASLLSKELGSALTGRNVIIELYPFSFAEFLLWEGVAYSQDDFKQAVKRGELKYLFQRYLQYGGMPEYLKFKEKQLLKNVYDDILYRDIIARYQIQAVKALRELGLYLMSNITTQIGSSKLKNMLSLGSVNTVKNYCEYLENSYIIFFLSRYSPSVKQQTLSHKKVYCIDNGLSEAVAFEFSKNKGHYLENCVFMQLKRQNEDFYFYITKDNLEVDFVIREGLTIKTMIQVAWHIDDEKTYERELRALVTAMQEQNCQNGMILTYDDSRQIERDSLKISVMPVYQWILTKIN